MMLIWWIVIFAASVYALIIASDHFTDAAEKIGLFFGMPPFIVGVIILSIGTSIPELASSIFSVTMGVPEVVLGTIMGSNIANIFLVLGISAIMAKKLKLTYEVIRVDLPLLIGSALWVVFVAFDGKFVFWEAILTILFFVVFVHYAISAKEEELSHKTKKTERQIIFLKYIHTPKKAKLDKLEMKEAKKEISFKTIVILLVSIGIIYFAAKYAVQSLIGISQGVALSAGVIAAIALAVGTSLPELAVSVQAARKKKYEMAVGTVVGSNIINTLLILGIPGLMVVIPFSHTMKFIVLPFMIGASFLFLFATQSKVVSRHEGWMLVLMYVLFVGTVITLG